MHSIDFGAQHKTKPRNYVFSPMKYADKVLMMAVWRGLSTTNSLLCRVLQMQFLASQVGLQLSQYFSGLHLDLRCLRHLCPHH